jgi:hypothetical protein
MRANGRSGGSALRRRLPTAGIVRGHHLGACLLSRRAALIDGLTDGRPLLADELADLLAGLVSRARGEEEADGGADEATDLLAQLGPSRPPPERSVRGRRDGDRMDR